MSSFDVLLRLIIMKASKQPHEKIKKTKKEDHVMKHMTAKKLYQNPTAQVISVASRDVLTASGDTNQDDDQLEWM